MGNADGAIAACWISVAIISAAILWVGGVTMLTLAGVVTLVGVAFVMTFGIAFGLAQLEKKSTIEH